MPVERLRPPRLALDNDLRLRIDFDHLNTLWKATSL